MRDRAFESIRGAGRHRYRGALAVGGRRTVRFCSGVFRDPFLNFQNFYESLDDSGFCHKIRQNVLSDAIENSDHAKQLRLGIARDRQNLCTAGKPGC